jgi:hypothetical protein
MSALAAWAARGVANQATTDSDTIKKQATKPLMARSIDAQVRL